ncbi:MAG TPA: glycosyltransferase family 2 protein [Bacteroidales bacterium]
MNISVIIPLYNEEESLPELAAWIGRVMQENHFTYEAIMIDDGSSDDSWKVVETLAAGNKNIKGIHLQRNYGKSAALYCGFKAAQGDVIITMDADLQDSPDEIPGLYSMIQDQRFDLVSGWKKHRKDPLLTKKLPSKLYNGTQRLFTGIRLHDMNCGLKAYRKKVVKSIEVFGEMHRYIPVLANKAGFKRIGEKVVVHQKRKYGVSKFGLERFVNGYLDLLTVIFISKFGKRPMHFFGALGTLMFGFGFIASLGLGIHKLYCVYNHIRVPLVTDSPYFYIALTTMILGTQLFLAGFLGELISRNSADRNNYLIDKEV